MKNREWVYVEIRFNDGTFWRMNKEELEKIEEAMPMFEAFRMARAVRDDLNRYIPKGVSE